MKEYVKHVKHVWAEDKERGHFNKSWCGKNVSTEFAFTGIDHAVANSLQGGRLVVCRKCWNNVLSEVAGITREDSE